MIIRKHLCWSLFLINLLIKKTPTQVFFCEYWKIFVNSCILQNTSGAWFWKIWVYIIHARFTQGLLQSSAVIFHFLLRKGFETYQIYCTILLIAFEFVFILKRIFCLLQRLLFQMACLQSKFWVLIKYMWSYNLFSVSSCFPRFSWSRLFRIQVFMVLVFQSPSPGSVSMF